MPSRRATACAVVRLSPVSMTTRTPSRAQRRERRGRRRLDRIGDGEMPASLAVDGHEDRRGAVARAARRPRARPARRSSMPCSRRNAALPITTRRPSTMPIAPLPVGRVEVRDRRRAPARARCAAATIARASGCSLRALDAGGEPQHLVLVERRRRHDRRHRRLALGQRAGLVDHQGVDLLHALERLGVLDQHAGCAPRPTPTMIDIGRREAERTGAGDDQHRDRRDQGVGEAAAPGPNIAQAAKASTATAMTAGTNQPETWSASRWIGARLRCASATIATIWASMRVAPDLLGAHDEARRSG